MNNLICALDGRLEGLDGRKILVQGVGTFCPLRKPHSEKKKSLNFLYAVGAVAGNPKP